MNFLSFKEKMYKLVCFTTNQISIWFPDFNNNNLTRWINKGLLIRLRQGLYTFPEYKSNIDFIYYFANRIYQPSYISLFTALSFYGMIPETIIQITSVTSLKTVIFKNDFGEYSYKSLKEELFFGYDLKSINGGLMLKFSKPEKALLDLFYLYPFYNSEKDMIDLRFDEDFIQDNLDVDLLTNYSSQFKSKAVDNRINTFLKAYNF